MGEKKKEEEEEEEEEAKKAAEEETKEEEQPNKETGDAGDKKEANNDDKGGGSGDVTEAAPAPPPPEDVVLRVYMHCEGCARKVKRCLKGFQGVEEVTTDCKTHKVVVKGKNAAEDPLKVVERVQRKSGRKVELLSPIPPPPLSPEEEEKKNKAEEEEKKTKVVEPVVVSVVLNVHMHCEACAQDIKRRILKMKGVQEADPDLKASQVTVKGVFEPAKLVEYVYKRTGKHAAVLNQISPEKKTTEEASAAEEPKVAGAGEAEEQKPAAESDEKAAPPEGGGDPKEAGGADIAAGEENKEEVEDVAAAAAAKGLEMRRSEMLRFYYQRYPVEYAVYPPQIFSDENPNACAVM